jgi:hypothetical protein
MVFANNTDIVTDFFYLEEYFHYYPTAKLDIWRIDTKKVDADWYIDLNMGSMSIYVCTPNAIPADAMELFHLSQRICSYCDRVEDGTTVRQVLSIRPPQTVKSDDEAYRQCCYREIAEFEVTQKYHIIEDTVERYGQYRLR